MPRTARASVGDVCYHVINRGNARGDVFHKHEDFAAFVTLLEQACERLPMRVLAYCLMSNHFHMVLRPLAAGDLSRWMQWLLTSHVRRYHRHYQGSGHVWQGRFKAFPIQQDEHLLTVLRYVERNPVRANLVQRAEQWAWSSAAMWRKKELPAWLHVGPVRYEGNWLAWVNRPQTGTEEEALRKCIARGSLYGGSTWQRLTARRLGLESSLRPRGRPRIAPEK
jgi:putative transposase